MKSIMKYDGIVLFSDLDCTLLDDQRQLSNENFEALMDFVKQGGRFGVATGRIERTVFANFPELPINTPSIFFNGALVYDFHTREQIYSFFMPEGLESIFQNVLDHYPNSGVEVNTAGEAFVLRYNDIIRSQIEREGLTSLEAVWHDIPKKWYKVLIADKHDSLEQIKKEIDDLRRTDIKIMFSEKEILDIVAQNVSKGEALLHQKMVNRENWRLVFAVGDNDNDLEMIQEADVGIAVANATPGVKEAAQYEIAHHNIPCIPQVLNIIDTYL